jgi:hypothetical protein
MRICKPRLFDLTVMMRISSAKAAGVCPTMDYVHLH